MGHQDLQRHRPHASVDETLPRLLAFRPPHHRHPRCSSNHHAQGPLK
eukprot:CAMPEP_0197700460 /NCGR_PEP_ID=MMETSP1338-20131121/122001_1 /TAXON_ID=43686 ORGANISM="Pelagodinium beii, Strain RCC1491" /NCGR_SAMPLE_ID=MMETSP1338 /ASSEMBLY_ACC=CAM_ASM_000754 /LENGTH=46 /DNA_ID= /DNA_START= /DNA_END= /DNA_ORIENTATION=